MKTNNYLGLLVALLLPLLGTQAQTPVNPPPPGTDTPPAVSPGAAELVKMADGTSDDVLLAYVKNSTTAFELSADQILYLRDIGISSPVISAMLSRDSELRNQSQSYTYDQKLYPAAPPAAGTPTQAPPPPEPGPHPAAVEAPLTPPTTYVSSPPPEVGYFYANLSPYGTWVQLEGVGWCWQPRVVVVNHAWRPYCDSGHWVNTDAGWFWQSDYSWGWAPFHYGRWQLHERCGWVWTPDRVWGPAWVTWRSEGDHCGWAPLPPHADFDLRLGYRFNGVRVGLNFDFGLRPDHFTFIALRDFHEHDFAHHRMAPTEVAKVYSHTTVINNYVVNNNTVVNQGIKVERVSAATHTEFKKVAIRDVPAGSPGSSNTRVAGKSELVVYRPQLKAPARPVNMVAQKVDTRHPVIQHTPIVPSTSQRPLVTGSTSASGANRNVHGQNPGNWTQPTTERAPGNGQAQQAPKAYRSGNSSAPSAPTAPPATRAQQARPATSASPDVSRPNSREQTPHTYYPKGYYPSSETHILPPANARPSDSRGQPSLSPRPSSPPDSGSGGRGQGGPSKKKDQ